MSTLLLAGRKPFDLSAMASIVPQGLEAKIETKVFGDMLSITCDSRCVAEITNGDEESDADTMDDLAGAKNPPAAFSDAMSKRELRFIIATVLSDGDEDFLRVVNAFVQHGIVEFDCSDGIRKLAQNT